MGAALCLLSAACFGAMAIFGKFAYAAGVAPGSLLLVRFALAAALLWLLLARFRERVAWTPRLVLTALALGAVGYAAQASLFFGALQVMDASLLSLILYTFPVLVTVGAVLLGRDRLSIGRVVALATASGGVVLVLAGAGRAALDPRGTVLAFGAAVTYTVYILVADRVVHRIPPLTLSALVMTGAAVTMAGRAAVTGGADLDFGPAGWFWVACIAVVSTVLAMLTFFAGLRRTGPSSAAILSTFEPVVTTALAALLLGEFLTPVQMAGGVLVLASVVILQIPAAGRAGPGKNVDRVACVHTRRGSLS